MPQTIIYNHGEKDKVARINNSQKVITKEAWSEDIPETVGQVLEKQPNPDFDPTDPTSLPEIDVLVDQTFPAHTINHPDEKSTLSGQDLVDWFISNQRIEPDFDIVEYFVVDPSGPQPKGVEVTNVDYVAKTWQELIIPITKEMVNTERNKRMETFTYNSVKYDFDEDSRQNIAGASILALAAIGAGKQVGDYRWANPDKDFGWIAKDNSLILMDAQTCFDFSGKAASWKSHIIFSARTLKDQNPIPTDYDTNETHWS